jgi:hypothetical protein
LPFGLNELNALKSVTKSLEGWPKYIKKPPETLELQLYCSFHSGYHILHIFGPSADEVQDILLTFSPVTFKGWFAAVYPLLDSHNLERPLGLPQLLYVLFHSSLDWLEYALSEVLALLGPVLHYSCSRRGSVHHYTVLVEYSKSYFKTAV